MAQEKVSADELTLEDGELFHDRKGRVKEWPRPLAPLAESHGHLTSFHRHDPEVAICRAALAGVRMLVVPFDPVDEVPRKFATAQEFLGRLDAEVEGAARRIEECAEHGLYVPEFEGYDAPALVDNVRIVVGVHPYGAAGVDEAALGEIEALLACKRCVGVGEIGLVGAGAPGRVASALRTLGQGALELAFPTRCVRCDVPRARAGGRGAARGGRARARVRPALLHAGTRGHGAVRGAWVPRGVWRRGDVCQV